MKILSGDGLNIGGHKVSYTLLGAVAAIVGAFFVWKQLQGGGVSAGAAPSDTSTVGVAGNDYSGELANLSQQVSELQNALGSSPAPPPVNPTVTQTAAQMRFGRMGTGGLPWWQQSAMSAIVAQSPQTITTTKTWSTSKTA